MIAAWRARLDARESASSYTRFRVALSLVALGTMGSVLARPSTRVIWWSVEDGGWIDHPTSWLFRAIGHSATHVGIVGAVTAVALVLGALGRGGRGAGGVALLGWLALIDLQPLAGGAYDELIGNGLFLLFIAGPGPLQLGRPTAWGDGTLPAWPRLIGVWQILLVYTASGWHKWSIHWVPWGDLAAVYDILINPTWRTTSGTWPAAIYPLTQVATGVVWTFEVTAPVWGVAWWITATRPTSAWRWVARAYLAVAVAMHLGLQLTLEVGAFGPTCAAFLFLLVHPRTGPDHALAAHPISPATTA